MNQGKLEVVKQQMVRVNINILGISELKMDWNGKFNSDDHYICYCGQEPLRRNGVALIVKQRVRNAYNIIYIDIDPCYIHERYSLYGISILPSFFIILTMS